PRERTLFHECGRPVSPRTAGRPATLRSNRNGQGMSNSAERFVSGVAPLEAPEEAVRTEKDVATQGLLVLAVIVCSLLVYYPYRHNMTPLYAFWDGPSYMLIAHDFYEVRPGNPLAPDMNKPPFYASHLPGYPLLVRALSFVGYDHALLLATVLSM